LTDVFSLESTVFGVPPPVNFANNRRQSANWRRQRHRAPVL
jgi:hypothetical protein